MIFAAFGGLRYNSAIRPGVIFLKRSEMAETGKNHEAIKKAVLLLSELTRKSGPSGVTELARALDMPKATVHRILGILCEDNVVVKTADGRYKVGPTVLLWSGGYRYSTAVIELAAPWLRRLRDATNETVHLCVYNNGAAQYADRLDSTQNVTLRWSRLGSELPLYCTSAGRAILSQLPQEEIDAYLDSAELSPRTARTVTSKEELKKMLARFRVQGYAEEIEENEDNIRCLGGAITDREGYPVAAISLTAPTFRFTDEDAAKYGPMIAEFAREISRQLP